MAQRTRDQLDDRLFRRAGGDADLERKLDRVVEEESDRVREEVEKAFRSRFGIDGKLTLSA
jgi:hypothetical protein